MSVSTDNDETKGVPSIPAVSIDHSAKEGVPSKTDPVAILAAPAKDETPSALSSPLSDSSAIRRQTQVSEKNESKIANPAIKILFRGLNIRDVDHAKVVAFIARAGSEIAQIVDCKDKRNALLKSAPRSFVKGVKRLYKMKGRSGRGSSKRKSSPLPLNKIMKKMIPIVQSASAAEWQTLFDAIRNASTFKFESEWESLKSEVGMDVEVVYELIGSILGMDSIPDLNNLGSFVKNAFQSISGSQTTMILSVAQNFMNGGGSSSGPLNQMLSMLGMNSLGSKRTAPSRITNRNRMQATGRTTQRSEGNGGLMCMMRSFMGIQ